MTRFRRPAVPGRTLAAWRQANGWLLTEAAALLVDSLRAYKSYEEVACPQVVWMAALFHTHTARKRGKAA